MLISGEISEIDIDPEMSLLWSLRDIVKLTGATFAYGLGQRSACTVHLDGKPLSSCANSAASTAASRPPPRN